MKIMFVNDMTYQCGDQIELLEWSAPRKPSAGEQELELTSIARTMKIGHWLALSCLALLLLTALSYWSRQADDEFRLWLARAESRRVFGE